MTTAARHTTTALLDRRPEARTFSVQDLLEVVASSRVRIPSFQRGLKWDRMNARLLLESLFRGYPVGTLLLWEAAAPAGEVRFGSLTLPAPQMQNALWVVDGQQRIVSLARILLALDDPDQVHTSRSRTPPWFSNLLPEGPLRELIARQAGVSVYREFFLLHHLGEDLPGAVRIMADEALPETADAPLQATEEHAGESDWHFSLAGVQLKFSARREGRGLTIPVSGTGGDWIVKLPDARFPGVPENEQATMRWAKASGIDIPEIQLIPVAEISGLPSEASPFGGQTALAIRRFDRPAPGKRVHIEDFAQILGLYPEQKYASYNYETLANLASKLAGKSELDEFIRRLVFVIASGNGDAHLKNWSLIYPDGVNARLAPAYDLVSTIQYKADDQLALSLARSKRWQDATRESFLRLARKIGDDETRMASRIEHAGEAIMTAWHCARGDFGYTAQALDRISSHLARVPLFSAGT